MKKIITAVSVAALLGVAGVAFAQTAPGLSVRLVAPTTVQAGTDRTVATVQLTAGSGDVVVTALPVVLTGTGFSNCALVDNAGQPTGTVSTGSIRLSGGAIANFAYVCDVAAGASGTVSVTPASVVATVNGAATVVAGLPSGTPSASINGGGTTTTPGTPNTGTGGTTTTPGVPNTGAGGDMATTWATILVAGLVAVAAGAYTYRLRRS